MTCCRRPPSKPTGLTVRNDGLIQWDPPSAEDAASVTGYHLTADDGNLRQELDAFFGFWMHEGPCLGVQHQPFAGSPV